ncbi:MAG: hypothetical protein OJF62_000960 [Pseudolabrys sp.]|jgi:hypothetical protein|nr:hypothetical protein [Pseudolabrys sp.]
MFGDLIAKLDQPEIATAVLSQLDADLVEEIGHQAAAVSMTPASFAAGAIREFVERGGDDLWFQLLTVVRRAEDPTLEAIRTILEWVVVSNKA